jgi:hypothetical protein
MKPSTYIPSVGTTATCHERQSSPDASTVRTMTIPPNTSAILLVVETTAARVTLDATDPSAASAPSLVIQASSNPVLIPIGPGSTLKFCSTAGTASVLQAAYLK